MKSKILFPIILAFITTQGYGAGLEDTTYRQEKTIMVKQNPYSQNKKNIEVSIPLTFDGFRTDVLKANKTWGDNIEWGDTDDNRETDIHEMLITLPGGYLLTPKTNISVFEKCIEKFGFCLALHEKTTAQTLIRESKQPLDNDSLVAELNTLMKLNDDGSQS